MRVSSTLSTHMILRICFGVLFLSGCPNSIESPECFPEGIPACEVPFFDGEAFLIRECGDTCHNPEGAERSLDLQAPNIFDRLAERDTSAEQCSEDTPYINLVAEGDAWLNSQLLARVHGRCGQERMPPSAGYAPLTDAEKDCLENWIGSRVIGPNLPEYCESARFDAGARDSSTGDSGAGDAGDSGMTGDGG